MKWRNGPLRVSEKRFNEKLREDRETKSFDPRGVEKMSMRYGKPYVAITHVQDVIDENEDGKKSIVASQELKAGQYIFPMYYIHPNLGIIGKTLDAWYDPARGWKIHIDAVLRDENGDPVTVFDGEFHWEIDASAWYWESELVADEEQSKILRPCDTAPSKDEIGELAAERIARYCTRHELSPHEISAQATLAWLRTAK